MKLSVTLGTRTERREKGQSSVERAIERKIGWADEALIVVYCLPCWL